MKKKFVLRDVFQNIGNRDMYRSKDPDEHSCCDINNTIEEKSGIPYVKLFKYTNTKDKFMIFFAILCSIGTGLCQPLYMTMFGKISGEMIIYVQSIKNAAENKQELEETFMKNIVDFAILNIGVGILMFALTFCSTSLFNFTALHQIQRIRMLYFSSALHQDISWFDIHQSGDFSSRISDDLHKIENAIGEKLSVFLHLQTTCVSSFILAFVKGWELTLVCLIFLPVILISISIVTLLMTRIAKTETDAYSTAAAFAEEVLTNIRTVIAFDAQQNEIDSYNKYLKIAQSSNIRRSISSGIGFGLVWFFIFSNYALSFWYGVNLVLKEKDYPESDRSYDVATMITVFMSVMIGSINFGISTTFLETFSIAKSSAVKVFSVIDSISIINKNTDRPANIETIKGDIDFQNIHFNYPARPNFKVLCGLNLHVKAGETIALVGTSGCGKSTCIQLIQRFYDPTDGEILLDKTNLKGFDLKWLRSNIGVVSQEPILFGTTINENIKLGYPNATQEDVEEAARKANVHNFIVSLPQKYNTHVGERGVQLSTGQKQRIAIARALIRQPKILLFDEATSALDSNTEAIVQDALDFASTKCTTIIVAHRLSTIKNVDRIVVISNGEVKEEGNHHQLIGLKGIYYNLITTQMLPSEKLTQHEKLNSEVVTELPASSPIQSSNRTENIENEKQFPVPWWAMMKMCKPERGQIIIGSLASFMTGTSMPLYAWLFGGIIGVLGITDEVVLRKETTLYCIYFIIAGLIIGISTFFQIYTLQVAGAALTTRLRSAMFSAILKQDMEWFDRKENAVGSLGVRLSSEASLVQGATGQCLGTVLQSLATVLLAVGLAIYLEYRLGLLAVGFAPFILLSTFFEKRLIQTENESRQKALARSTKIAVEALTNIRTVASLGCEKHFLGIFEEALIPYHLTIKRNIYFRAIIFSIARSLMFFAFAACIYYGSILIVRDHLEFENVFKISQTLMMSTTSIANALAFTPSVQKGLLAAKNIFQLLQRQPKIQDGSTVDSLKHGNIRYSNVSFSYPSRSTTPILKNLDFSIAVGKTVALVGPSGCGKSTIVQLLLRYYDPTEGKILLNGTNINTFILSDLRRYARIVAQEPSLFNRTIKENIAYGINEKEMKQNQIIEAAKKANIHTFITSLPLGYDTKLGEKGMQLSGGQKQRLAIARALIRKPGVLIFDEATSSLDSENETIVQRSLNDARKGCTCITIAHRLHTISDADVILVINEGQIYEIGSHDDLIQLQGLYYHLYRLQSSMH